MSKMSIKRVALVTTAAAALLLTVTADAQPYGMGAGRMMGGYGVGPGMMGGMGAYGMGPQMMWGNGAPGDYWGLDLTAEQRKKIAEIQDETTKAHWQLMGTMHQQDFHMNGMFGPGEFDEAEARKSFQAMTEARKAMFELHLQARKRIEAVLTKEQREMLHRRPASR